MPAFDPGDYATLALKRPSSQVDDEAVDHALQRLRERAARFEPVEGRGVVDGDTVTVDLDADWPTASPTRTRTSRVELGAKANPPGFDEQLLGLEVGATKSFDIHYPADYPIGELANTDVSYTVTVKAHQAPRPARSSTTSSRRTSASSRRSTRCARACAQDLEHEARHAAERDVRGDLMKQLAARVPFEVPPSLIEREIDRRLEEFARRLMEQNIDPRQAGIDWNAFRESQRDVAREAVASAIVLDEVARRETARGDGRGGRAGNRALRGADRPDAGRGARAARERGRAVAGVGRAAAGEVD